MMTDQSPEPAAEPLQQQVTKPQIFSSANKLGLGLTFFGFIVFILGVRPGLFGLDQSPVVGFVQIAVFLVGLAIICIGGYISLRTFWRGQEMSIAADIGLRLVGTGYVIAVFSGMADIFGFGSDTIPGAPNFGGWQAAGVLIGEMVIAIGFVLMLPFFSKESDEDESMIPDQGNV
jgi:hypothetical protein